jgi:L-asparagine oxygenase
MTMKIFQLSSAQQNELRQAYAAVPSPYAEPYGALTGLYKAFGALPAPLLHEVLQFGRDPASPGCMLVDGLPIDAHLPDTPVAGTVPGRRASIQKSLLGLAVGRHAGGLPSEKDGSWCCMVPCAAVNTQSNRGSKVFLTFHNDSMFDESMAVTATTRLPAAAVRADRERGPHRMPMRAWCAPSCRRRRETCKQPRFQWPLRATTLLIRGAGR